MHTINISLPELLGEFAQNRIDEDGYEDPSDYFKALVEADCARQAQERLEALLLDGVRSETVVSFDQDWYERKRADLIAAHSQPPKL